ncbi:MAG: DUF4375 domain-containing protein [Xanthobacteraceae bacterium]
MPGTLIDGRLSTVVIPRKCFDAASKPDGFYHLPDAVIDYVQDVLRAGVYARHELPARSRQLFHGELYAAEVNNGGHSQFIRNTGALLPTIVTDALDGLDAMGARTQHQILTEMAAWVVANPEEARAQTGFDVRAEPLDELDTRFDAAESEMPIARLAARWIATWPELRVVPDDQYSSVIDQIAALNPLLGVRLIWKSVQNIRDQMTERLQISIAAACGAVVPEPEAKIAVGGGRYFEIEGQQSLAFAVHTEKGARFCVFDDAWARLYEQVQRSPVPKLGANAKPDDIKNFKPPEVGKRLSTVGADTIRRFVAAANETRAPEAIDLLLRKTGLDPNAMITAWKLQDGGATWIVVAGGHRIVAVTSRHGAELIGRNFNPVPAATRAEIDRHVAEAAKGGASLGAPT